MRIGIAGFHHESNSFASVPATYEHFLEYGILRGDAIRSVHGAARTTVGGFLALPSLLPEVEVVPLVYAGLTPMGVITGEALERVMTEVLQSIVDGGPWDGVLLPQHGAAVSDLFPDADGEMIRRVRDAVGPHTTIGVSLDLHANISKMMVEYADVITVYQTSPHVDAYEQAVACGRLVARTIRGEVKPQMALAQPPVLIDILRQGTDDLPMSGLLENAAAEARRPGVLSVSVVEGYPWADVEEMGMSFLAITDDDAVLAADVAANLARAAWESRVEFVGVSWPVDDALRHADSAATGPVFLFDVGDNVGGGSPGDSTFILSAARRLGVRSLLQAVYDPAVAADGIAAGVGAHISTSLGGKTDQFHGEPLAISGTVTGISDGHVEDDSPTSGGERVFEYGPTCAIETDDGFGLVVNSSPRSTRTLGQFRSVGLDPCAFKIVVAKGVYAPRAAIRPIAAEMINVATPGVTSSDLDRFPYRRRRRPMYPFERDARWPVRDEDPPVGETVLRDSTAP